MPANPSRDDTGATLDVADGIARVMGGRALYGRILTRFHDDYRHGAAPLRAALAGDNLRLANRIAHTLKGAAGMFGAHRLQCHAGALELALRTPGGGDEAAIDALACSLSDVLEAIACRIAAEPAPHRAITVPLAGQTVLAQPAPLLHNGDGAAADLLEAPGASLKAALEEARFHDLSRAMDEFEFEGALAAFGRVADGDGDALAGRLSG